MNLPDELIREIFGFLDINSFAFAIRSCKRLNRLGQEASLWKYFCIRDFFPVFNVGPMQNWKNHYQTRLGLNYLQTPFPGKKGVFSVHPDRNWKVCYSGNSLLRKLEFVNQTKNSTFIELCLNGYEEGNIGMSLRLSGEENPSFENYLKSVNPKQKLYGQYKGYISLNNIDLMKRIFRIFSQFNVMPEKELELMRAIIKAKNWKKVTPLSEEETQTLELQKIEYENRPRWKPSCLEWLVIKVLGLDYLLR